jgi:hypothetical protein
MLLAHVIIQILAEYLDRRFSKPFFLLMLLGSTGLIAGVIAGFEQAGWEAALCLAFVGGVIGTLVGLPPAILVWLFRHHFSRPVRRPDLWGYPLLCVSCGWETTPEGPWRITDCMNALRECPTCGEPLIFVPAACPACGTFERRLVRWPKSLRQALWGGNTCSECGCTYDKWSRQVDG